MPGKFEFRLQPLLDRRQRLEEEKQRRFAACRRAADECAGELERLGHAWQQGLRQLVESARLGPAADLRLRDGHLGALEAALVDERLRRSDLEAACERAREELIFANRSRRVIQKLKERRARAFEAEETRREELELDEANARRHERDARKRLVSRPAGRATR